ncbi:hypothetical protein ACFSUK_31135 [Sphingobium scionense]
MLATLIPFAFGMVLAGTARARRRSGNWRRWPNCRACSSTGCARCR